jgi:hypothetical protein
VAHACMEGRWQFTSEAGHTNQQGWVFGRRHRCDASTMAVTRAFRWRRLLKREGASEGLNGRQHLTRDSAPPGEPSTAREGTLTGAHAH